MTIYSQLLYSYHGLPNGVQETAITAIAPNVYVVRDIVMHNRSANGTVLQGFLCYDDGFVTVAQCALGWTEANVAYHWQGRQVIEPGHELYVYALDNNWDVRISGYLFTS